MNLNSFMIGGSWWSSALIWLLIVGSVVVFLVRRKQIQIFTREVRGELLKASWPWEPKERGMKKYKELIDSTLIVLIAMILLAGYVGAWDFIMLNITKAVTHLAQ